MASVPMRVDVCVQFTTKNKKLFVNATFLLALCARPYPLPLGRKQHAIRVYPVCHVVIVGTLHRAIVSHGLHGPHGLWVVVGHSLFITHKHPRGKGTNFVHAVCGSCESLWKHF